MAHKALLVFFIFGNKKNKRTERKMCAYEPVFLESKPHQTVPVDLHPINQTYNESIAT